MRSSVKNRVLAMARANADDNYSLLVAFAQLFFVEVSRGEVNFLRLRC